MNQEQPKESNVQLDTVFKAVGQAVVLMQFFETLFALFAAGIIPAEIDPDMTEIPTSKLRIASKTLLRELKTKLDIDPGYDARLTQFIDDRHEVIHGGPIRCGGLDKYLEFTNKFNTEAAFHIFILLDLYRQWLTKYYGNTDPIPAELVAAAELIGRLCPDIFKWAETPPS